MFKTAYGLTSTHQDNAVGADETFASLRMSYDFRQQLTPNTEFTSVLIADENLDDTGDFRTDLINAVTVGMSSQLALKVSWQLLYDRQPSLVALPLFAPGGAPTELSRARAAGHGRQLSDVRPGRDLLRSGSIGRRPPT